MTRRHLLAMAPALPFATTFRSTEPTQPFQLAFAPHHKMFRAHAGEDILDQIDFAYTRGFRAWEDNNMRKRDPELQQKIGDKLAAYDMTMGVFVANTINWKEPTLTLGEGEHRDKFLLDIANSVEVAKRCNAKWVTVVPGFVALHLEHGYQQANLVETLKQGAAILEPHGLVMVLEPLNYRDHPGLFLTKAAQAYAICKAVDSPSCKILFDIYHQQIQEGNLIPNIEAAWEEIAYFQLGDNPGRKEPTTGEINYGNVLKFIADKGFKGVYGMEHGNSQDGKAGEQRVIDAYRTIDVAKM